MEVVVSYGEQNAACTLSSFVRGVRWQRSSIIWWILFAEMMAFLRMDRDKLCFLPDYKLDDPLTKSSHRDDFNADNDNDQPFVPRQPRHQSRGTPLSPRRRLRKSSESKDQKRSSPDHTGSMSCNRVTVPTGTVLLRLFRCRRRRRFSEDRVALII